MQNPITWAEIRYQNYVIQKGRAGWLWILLAGVLMLPALFSALAYTVHVGFLNGSIGYILDNYAASSPETALLLLGQLALITMNIAHTLVLTLISFALASNSIQREKDKRTWDILRTTGITAHQLVNGKLWASLYAMRGDHIMLTVIRVGMGAWVVGFSREILRIQNSPSTISATELWIFIAVIVALSLLDAVLNVAVALFCVLLEIAYSFAFSLFGFLRVLSLVVLAQIIGGGMQTWQSSLATNQGVVANDLIGGAVGVVLAYALCVVVAVGACYASAHFRANVPFTLKVSNKLEE